MAFAFVITERKINWDKINVFKLTFFITTSGRLYAVARRLYITNYKTIFSYYF